MTQNNELSKNLLICGDNLKALDDLVKRGIKVDLIYLDPPFFSNKHYEVVWGDEAEIRSFKDRWAGGINVYIEWMRERVVKMYDILKDTGSFYLHCDWHASHYLKVMLDEIFTRSKFRNELIWCYSGRELSQKQWNSKHDNIFFYTKSNRWVFNWKEVAEEPSPQVLAQYKHVDEKGKRYVIRSKTGGKGLSKESENTYRQYYKKVPPRTWVHISFVSSSHERLGYPTQKPEALLERIIKASSNKGDIVLDPFCGCGTAMTVSQQLGRKWIGIDISPTAINLIEKRLGKVGAKKSQEFDVIGMPTTLVELEKLEPFEFQNWVIYEMRAKQSKRLVADMGIDGYYEKTIFTYEAGIQVKQSEKIGRNVVDNFETALRRRKYEKGYIVAFSFTKGAYEEVARVKGKGLDIKLVEVEDLLLGKFKV